MRFIPQRHYNDCALACVAMILNAFHSVLNYYSLPLFLLLNPSLFDMRSILKLNNIESKTYYMANKDLPLITTTPIIIHSKSLFAYHFSIITEIKKGKSLVYNPAYFGKRWISNRRIEKKWTGYYLKIENWPTYREKDGFYIPYFIYLFLKIFVIGLIVVLITLF